MIILNGASLDNKSRCSQSLMSWANEFGLDADVMHKTEHCADRAGALFWTRLLYAPSVSIHLLLNAPICRISFFVIHLRRH
jgi:hypothetical protein